MLSAHFGAIVQIASRVFFFAKGRARYAAPTSVVVDEPASATRRPSSAQPAEYLDEIGLRIAAAEAAIAAITPWINDDVIDDAVATLLVELQSADEARRGELVRAVQLLRGGATRFRRHRLAGWMRHGV